MVRKLFFIGMLVAICIMAWALPAFAQGTGDPTSGNFGQLAPVIAVLTGALIVFLPGARGVTWIVDRIRDAVPFGDDPNFKIVWPLAALVVALIACLGWQINVVGGILTQIPRFAGSTALDGTAGQVLTAVGIAGASSSWHDRDKAKNPPHLPVSTSG